MTWPCMYSTCSSRRASRKSSSLPKRFAHFHPPDPSWISLTQCRNAGQIFDLSLQRHESIQTANPLPMPSSSRSEGSDQERSNQEGSDQHEGSDEEEGSDPLPLGLIAYQFHYFEVNARIFCVNLTQMDANHKVCSLRKPHPWCSSNII